MCLDSKFWPICKLQTIDKITYIEFLNTCCCFLFISCKIVLEIIEYTCTFSMYMYVHVHVSENPMVVKFVIAQPVNYRQS